MTDDKQIPVEVGQLQFLFDQGDLHIRRIEFRPITAISSDYLHR